MLIHFATIAWRNLIKYKYYSIVNIIGLSIGIGACLTIFLIVRYELSFDKFHTRADTIYRVYSEFSGDYTGVTRTVPTAAVETTRNTLTGYESLTGFFTYTADVSVLDGIKGMTKFETQNQIILAGPDYFDVFKNYEWLFGSSSSLSQPFQVVLSESRAKKYFGVSDISYAIGREIHYNDSLVASVSGIVKDLNNNTDLKFTEFISISTVEKSWLSRLYHRQNWNGLNSAFQFFIRLDPMTNWDTQLSKLDSGYVANNDNVNFKITFHLQPISNLHFNEQLGIFDTSIGATNLSTLKIISFIALLILAVAAVNFFNIETARSSSRAKEVGMRKVLGSSKKEIILFYLLENITIAFLGLCLAILISYLAIRYLSEFIPSGVALDIDLLTISFLLFMLLVVSFSTGLYSAFKIASFPPVVSQNYGIHIVGDSPSFRKGLIVFQYLIAQLLILFAVIVATQERYMLGKDLGFITKGIVYFYSPWWEEHRKCELLKAELEKIPEIEMLTISQGPPAYPGYFSSTLNYFDGKEEFHNNVFFEYGDPNYLNVYNLKLKAGRNFEIGNNLQEFIINETYAKLLGFNEPENALDKDLFYGSERIRIVGVVKDFNFQSLHNPIKPLVISNRGSNLHCFGVKLIENNGNIPSVLSKIEKTWTKIYKDQKCEFKFLDDTVKSFYEKEIRTSKLANVVTGVALIISVLGMLGLVSFTTAKRTKEIGIRKVLGATTVEIGGLLGKEFMKPVLLAFIIAAPLSMYFGQLWLMNFAFHITIGWEIFILTILISMSVVVLCVSLQTAKAASANPIDSLKYE